MYKLFYKYRKIIISVRSLQFYIMEKKKESPQRSEIYLAEKNKTKIIELLSLKNFVRAFKQNINDQQKLVIKQNIKQIMKNIDATLQVSEKKILHQYMLHHMRTIAQKQQTLLVLNINKLKKQKIMNQSSENRLINYFIKIFEQQSASASTLQNSSRQSLIADSQRITQSIIEIFQISQNKSYQYSICSSDHQFQILLVVLYNLNCLYQKEQNYKIALKTVQNCILLLSNIRQKKQQSNIEKNKKIQKFNILFQQSKVKIQKRLSIQNQSCSNQPIFENNSFLKNMFKQLQNKFKSGEVILPYLKKQQKVSLKTYYNYCLYLKKINNLEQSLAFFKNTILAFQEDNKIIKAMHQDQQTFRIFLNSYLHVSDIFKLLSFPKWSKQTLKQMVVKLNLMDKMSFKCQKIGQLNNKYVKYISKILQKVALIEQKQNLMMKNNDNKESMSRFQRISLNSYRITKIKQKEIALNSIMKQNLLSNPVSVLNSLRVSPQKKYKAYEQTTSFLKKTSFLKSKFNFNQIIQKKNQQKSINSSIKQIQTQKFKQFKNQRKNMLLKSSINIKSKKTIVSANRINFQQIKLSDLILDQNFAKTLQKRQDQIGVFLEQKQFKQVLARCRQYIVELDNCFKQSQKRSNQKYEQIKTLVFNAKLRIIPYFQKINNLPEQIAFIKQLLLQIKLMEKDKTYASYRQLLIIKLAECYKQNNQLQLAIQTYMDITKSGNPEPFIKIGQIYLQSQEFPQAIKYFQKYCIQKQFNYESKIKLAHAYSKIPQYCLKAIDILTNILFINTSHSSPIQLVNFDQLKLTQEVFQFSVILLSNLHRKNQNIQKAIKICQAYISILPLSCNVLYILGNYYYQSGDIKKAYTSYLDTLRVNPRHHQSLLQLINFVSQNQEYKSQVIFYLKKMLLNDNQVNFQILKYMVKIIDTKSHKSISEQSNPQNLLKCANILENFHEQHSQYFSLVNQILRIYLLIQQLIQTQSTQSLNTILRYEQIYRKLGKLYFQKGNFVQSQKYFNKNIKILQKIIQKQSLNRIQFQRQQHIQKHKESVLVNLGNLKKAQFKHTQALQFYKHAQQCSSNLSNLQQIELLVNIGDCEFELKKYKQAKINYEKCLKQLYNDEDYCKSSEKGLSWQSYTSLTNLLQRSKNKQNLSSSQTLIKYQIQLKIAFCQDKLQNYLQSKQIYKKVMQQVPEQNEIYCICVVNLANIYLITDQQDVYIQKIQAFLKLKPERFEIRRQLIQIYKSKEMFSQMQRHRQFQKNNHKIGSILKTIREMNENNNKNTYQENHTTLCRLLDY